MSETLTLEQFAQRCCGPEMFEKIIKSEAQKQAEIDAFYGSALAEMGAEHEADDRAYLEYGWVS